MRNGKPVEGPSFAALTAQNYALGLMGRRTGAFEAVVSNDIEMFRPGRIDQFDAICFCNSLGVLFDDRRDNRGDAPAMCHISPGDARSSRAAICRRSS